MSSLLKNQEKEPDQSIDLENMNTNKPPFSRSTPEFVSDLLEVLKTPEEPSILSKCYATVEYVLCRRQSVDPKHVSVEDHGWPVKRHYIMSAKKYSIFYHSFDLYFMEDSESILVVVLFNPLSYKVIDFHKHRIPFESDYQRYDHKFNVDLIDLIDSRMFNYMKKIRSDELPQVEPFENKYISMTISSKEEFDNEIKEEIHQGIIYQTIVAVDNDTNPISHNMPMFYRLYRTVLPILDLQCTDIPDLKLNKKLKLENKYEGEFIKILFRNREFHISLVEGLLCYFLNIRIIRHYNEFSTMLVHKLLGGYRIPVSHVPSFIPDSYNNYVDNIKIDSLNHFIKEILHRSLTQTKKIDDRREARIWKDEESEYESSLSDS